MRWPDALLALLLASLTAGPVGRAEAGDVTAGRRLLAENGCDGACHRSHAPDDDPIGLYTRPDRKVRSRAELLAQVGFCVSRLGSMIFPEELDDVAAALDHDHYHFE